MTPDEHGDMPALGTLRDLLRTDPTRAEDAIVRLLAERPDRRATLRLLARSLRGEGLNREARLIDEVLLSIASRDPAVSSAIKAFAAGRHNEAERLVRKALAHGRENMAATLLLAEIAAAAGIDAEAISLYRQALELAPDHHETKFRLANALFRQNNVVAALALADEVVASRPDDISRALLRLTMLAQIGEYAEARGGFAALLDRHPEAAFAWVGYANLLKTTGEAEASVTAYRRAIAIAPGMGEAWWGLADLKSGVLDDGDIAAMNTELGRSAGGAHQAMHLHFALGMAHEEGGRYAESFRHYAEANRLARATRPHDAAAATAEKGRATRLFDREFFADRTVSGRDSIAPVFVVGMPRSGSTLIEQILASHSAIEGTAELPYMPLLAHRLLAERWSARGVTYPDIVADLDRDGLAALGDAYLDAAAIHRKTDRPYFIDKLPENWSHIGLIHLILPRATIIDARREPMACGFSNFKQFYAKGRSFAFSLADIGRYYADYVDALAHFDAVLPGRVLRVQHEDLVGDPERQVRRMLAHIGVPFEPACLRFHENTRPVRTASAAQVRRPIDASGGDQWRHYRQWLSPLAEALGPALNTDSDPA